MDVKKYISSGILELYLAGTLTEEENWEVHQNAKENPKIKEEILSIEAAILELSKATCPKTSRKKGFEDLKNRIGEGDAVQISKKRIDWRNYRGLAAIVLFAIGLLWSLSKISSLKSDIDKIDRQNQVLQLQMIDTRDSLTRSNELLKTIRSENTLVISLDGQDVSPISNAKIYWNKEEKKLYIDAQGLPEPPDGLVYQVWSLKLSPFAPTSVGILEGPLGGKNKIFVLSSANIGESEAFGITLEPHGGSNATTLEQMYALGDVSS